MKIFLRGLLLGYLGVVGVQWSQGGNKGRPSGLRILGTKKDASVGVLCGVRALGRSKPVRKNLRLVAKALLVAVGAHTLLPLVLIDFCFPAFL